MGEVEATVRYGRPWQPSEAQLLCRDLHHAWVPHTASRLDKGFVRILRCERCSSMKEQTLDSHGFILKTTMIYAVGYVREGEGRLTQSDRAELRVRNLSE